MNRIVNEIEENYIQKISSDIENVLAGFYENPEMLDDFVLGVQRCTNELARQLIRSVLINLDETIRDSEERKEKWLVKARIDRKILTSLGEIAFKHTYYTSRDGENSRFLLDEMIGLDPNQQITTDAIAAIYEESANTSYRRAGEKVSPSDQVSRQTVKNVLHVLRFPEEEKPQIKKEVETIYIEADEDHVALQFLQKKGDLVCDANGRKNNCAIAKLVYIHEGREKCAPESSRYRLVNPHYFAGLYPGEDNKKLWEEVFEYLNSHYDLSKVKVIYLGADGGNWIQSAFHVIPKLRPALDEFHISQYLIKMTAFLMDSAADVQASLKTAIREDDKNSFRDLVDDILDHAETESAFRRIRSSADYLMNHWEAAGLRLRHKDNIIGCSAEGHVSHILSARLSSRDLGWSYIGVDKMCRLRAYKANGGDYLKLARYQRCSGQAEDLPKAAGAEGLSCTQVMRSERSHQPDWAKYVEAASAAVSQEITKQYWYKGLCKSICF